ncbi:DUF1456 family protein [Pseudomonadota bacterium]
MTNNDILRRIRYAFNFSDSKMIALFGAADLEVTREQISAWMKKDDDPDLQELQSPTLATFLNGLINNRRGKREGPQPEPEQRLNNNIILRKLKIALNFRDEDIIETVALAGKRLGKPELSSFFRKPGHKNHRACLDQVLRNFLTGLALKLRAEKSPAAEVKKTGRKTTTIRQDSWIGW